MYWRERRIKREIALLEEAARDPERWEEYWEPRSRVRAELVFPLGEIFNPGIRGFLWAWVMKGKLRLGKLTKEDAFSADGLEGKAVVETDLVGALLAARELPPFRRGIRIVGERKRQ